MFDYANAVEHKFLTTVANPEKLAKSVVIAVIQ
jgi:hypothetical protein